MPSELIDPLSPALKDAALLNLGWQPDHVVIDASSGLMPESAAASADWITFFGPFIQMPDPEVYHCLEQAAAALKPDGKLVFTFLDYDVPAHWQIFRESAAPPHFLNRSTIEAWAMHLGLSLEYHYSGEVSWLQPLQSGAVEAIGLGQSLVVLSPVAELS
jgi:hypothetical protein